MRVSLNELYGELDEISRFTLNNVAQCWRCNNCHGASKRSVNGQPYLVPQCKVLDVYVLEVYDRPCRAFREVE